jgi:hypothetical protein
MVAEAAGESATVIEADSAEVVLEQLSKGVYK